MRGLIGFAPVPIREALAVVERGEKTYAEALSGLVEVHGEADVAAFTAALARFEPKPPGERELCSDLYALTSVFQAETDEETTTLLRTHAIQHLIHIYDRAMGMAATPSDLVFVLKILALYGTEEGARRVLDGAYRYPDEYLWPVVLRAFGKDHPCTEAVIAAFSAKLPRGLALAAFLDVANGLCITGKRSTHPFDVPEGHAELRRWLTDPGDYAQSAVAALPFIQGPEREELLRLAFEHPSAVVRMEAAWALAKLGRKEGFDALALVVPRSQDRLAPDGLSTRAGGGRADPDRGAEPGVRGHGRDVPVARASERARATTRRHRARRYTRAVLAADG